MLDKFKKIIYKLFSSNKTYMEREIEEEPEIINKIIRKYVKINYNIDIEIPDNIKKITFIASGSSYNSACIVSYFLNSKNNNISNALYASEIAIDENFNTEADTMYIFISQSGETSDTNIALNKISKETDKTFALTNTKNSTLYNNAKFKMLTNAGSEKAIASTKAMTAQTFCLFLIALKFLELNNINITADVDNLMSLSSNIQDVISKKDNINALSKIISNSDNIVILSNNIFTTIAKEGALKIQETSYISSLSYPFGEFMHGHMAILNKKTSVIAVINEKNYTFAHKVLLSLKSKYKFDVILISNIDLDEDFKNNSIKVCAKDDISYSFALLTLYQILSLCIAKQLNNDIDKPQGLTKIVQ